MYDCSCESCQKINLAASSDGPVFKSVLKAAENAFKHLHKKGSYTPEDLKDKPYQKLIEETNKVFNSAVTDNDIPPEMLAKLQNDTFVFSGLKTHAQLLEASTMLMEDGKIRGFDAFANDFNKVNTKYNQNYLEAEWQFAVTSSQSAANWAAIDESGRYNLQYRTANDDRVRADHAALQDITLPVDDPFWMSYYPPNGWRCRCIAVEVLKAKYELADSVKANEAGDRATTKLGPDGKNRSEIFRFNPGAEQKVFPPKHPYNKVKDAEEVKAVIEEVIKKEEVFENLNIKEVMELYKTQKVNKSDKDIIDDFYHGYVGTANSFDLNNALRTDVPFSPEDERTIKSLDSLINENSLSKNYNLHRFINDDFISDKFGISTWGKDNQQIIERLKESGIKEYDDKGYLSTSMVEKKNKFQERKFQLEIRAKKGTPGFLTTNFVESELILKRGQKMKVIDFEETDKGRIKVIVETID